MKVIFIFSKSITFNTFLQSQAKYLIKKGYKVEVACSDIENLNFRRKLSYKINFPNRIIELFNIIKYIEIFMQIKSLVKDNPQAIFYLHTPLASHLFRFFTFLYRLKIIYFVHGFRFTLKTNFLKSFFFKTIEKFLSLKTNVFITINNEDFKYAKFNLLGTAKCYKIKGIGLNLSGNYLKKKLKRKKKSLKF